MGRSQTKGEKKYPEAGLLVDIPQPAGTLEIDGKPMVAIPLDAWESIIEEIEDMKGYLRSKAVLDDPKSVFIPLEEAEKNWFDNNIKKVRKRKKITQKEFAKRMRVSQARISRIENPDYRPSAGVYERAAKALGCGLNDLI
ncbi:MAG: helix-turn-helix domain-containing protein [bacterium]|nr:helix-turn-helix transcriptional regulator [bacterium]